MTDSKCPKCGIEVKEGEKFCLSCGTKLIKEADKVSTSCPKCGKEITKDAKFCLGCGASLAKKDVAPPTPASTTDNAPVQNTQVPKYQGQNPDITKPLILLIITVLFPVVGFIIAIIKYRQGKKESAKSFAFFGLLSWTGALSIAFTGGFGVVLPILWIILGYVRLKKGLMVMD